MRDRVDAPGGKNARRNPHGYSHRVRLGKSRIDVCRLSVCEGVHADALMPMVKEGEHQSEVGDTCVCHSGHVLVIL